MFTEEKKGIDMTQVVPHNVLYLSYFESAEKDEKRFVEYVSCKLGLCNTDKQIDSLQHQIGGNTQFVGEFSVVRGEDYTLQAWRLLQRAGTRPLAFPV